MTDYPLPDFHSFRSNILADHSASYWLKEAVRASDRRDPVDALHDAKILARLLSARCEELRVPSPARPYSGGYTR